MEPTANSPRPPDIRTPPNRPPANAFEPVDPSVEESAAVEPLSSWYGPGTSYTVMPRAVPPAPVEPALQPSPEVPADALSPGIAELDGAEAALLKPAARPLMNWPLMIGVVVGMLLTVLLIALWYSWVTYSAPDAPANRAGAPAEAPDSAPPAPANYSQDDMLTQEPLDDAAWLTAPSEPTPEALPAPAVDDRQPAADADGAVHLPPIRSSAPTATPGAEQTTPTAPAPVQKHPQPKQPALPAPAAPAPRNIPEPIKTSTITDKKPAIPAKPRSAPTPAASGTLVVAVQPWAEVWIDGRKRGISPPLLKLQLPPGIYTIELRNPDLPSYSQKVQIAGGQSVTLQHSFQ